MKVREMKAVLALESTLPASSLSACTERWSACFNLRKKPAARYSWSAWTPQTRYVSRFGNINPPPCSLSEFPGANYGLVDWLCSASGSPNHRGYATEYGCTSCREARCRIAIHAVHIHDRPVAPHPMRMTCRRPRLGMSLVRDFQVAAEGT